MDDSTDMLFTSNLVMCGANGPYFEDQTELIGKCPEEFRLPNSRWRLAVLNYRVKRLRGAQGNWVLKEVGQSGDQYWKRMYRLITLLEYPRSLFEDVQALTAWMMSELLEKLPE